MPTTTISDATLWAEVREAAAELGWGVRGPILQRAHQRLLRRHEWPAGSHGLMKRLEALWDKEMLVTRPN